MQGRAKAVADKLRGLILEKGWNQSELARRSGMRPSNVSNYLRGSNVPNPKQLAKLADALGTTPGDILNVGGEMEAPKSRALSVSQVEEREGHLRLQVDQVVPAEVATQVLGLLIPQITHAPQELQGMPVAENDEEAEMPQISIPRGSILDTLLPANPPKPVHAKQVRPLDGPAPVDPFDQKNRKVA